MFKNLIFDWSGTLVDDLALTLDASNYVFSQYGKPCMNRDEFRAEFQLPYPDYYARVLPQADLNELEDHFRYAFRVSTATVEVLPHAAGIPGILPRARRTLLHPDERGRQGIRHPVPGTGNDGIL